MCIFNVGLTYGLGAIGSQTGSALPAAFMQLPIVENSPHYPEIVGFVICVGFAFLLGFGSTLAEPALNALGLTVQELTNGAFKKSMLMYSVATGVAVGIALGVAKLIFHLDLMMLLLPLYAIGVIMTFLSTEEFVNVAWDSAGVTTGPVTVPLVLAMGLGLGNAVSAIEGFGILSLASICPIGQILASDSIPKPSIAETALPNPNPMARTSGTVTGPVVTPALSQATFTNSSVDRKVIITPIA